MTSGKPTFSAIRAMIAAQSPDQTPEGKVRLANKLSFMEKPIPKPRSVSKTKRNSEEEELQIWLCDWLKTQPRILYWANPKQVFRGKLGYGQLAYLKKLQRMGAKKGLPDLCMLFRNKHGASVFCFAELKKPLGYAVTSEEQEGFLEACNERGGYSGVVRSLENLQQLLAIAGY